MVAHSPGAASEVVPADNSGAKRSPRNGSARSFRINASNTLTASVLTLVLHALVLVSALLLVLVQLGFGVLAASAVLAVAAQED